MFEKIKENALKEIDERYFKALQKAQESEDGLKQELTFYGREYQGTTEQQIKKFSAFLNKRMFKEREAIIKRIKEIENADDFKNGELIITIEWKKSQIWGSNPKAYTNYGYKSESIGGYGYCKLSTATAKALNSYKPLLKLLYLKEERRLKEKPTIPERRAYIGYGSGYGSLPYFEGGVGVSSHENIIKSLGLNMKCVTSTNQTDVYSIKI